MCDFEVPNMMWTLEYWCPNIIYIFLILPIPYTRYCRFWYRKSPAGTNYKLWNLSTGHILSACLVESFCDSFVGNLIVSKLESMRYLGLMLRTCMLFFIIDRYASSSKDIPVVIKSSCKAHPPLRAELSVVLGFTEIHFKHCYSIRLDLLGLKSNSRPMWPCFVWIRSGSLMQFHSTWPLCMHMHA